MKGKITGQKKVLNDENNFGKNVEELKGDTYNNYNQKRGFFSSYFLFIMLGLSLFEFFISSIYIGSLGIYVIESLIVFLILFVILIYLLLSLKRRKWSDVIIVFIFTITYLLSIYIFVPSGFLSGNPKEKYVGFLYFPGIIKEFSILYSEKVHSGLIENIDFSYRFSPNFIVSLIMLIICFKKVNRRKVG